MKKSPMIEVQETDSGLYVTDAAKNELHIEMPDWEEGGNSNSFYRNVDIIMSGRTSKIIIPASAVTIITEGKDKWRILVGDFQDRSFESGKHQIQVSTTINSYIRVDSAFNISYNKNQETFTFIFPSKISVNLGFRANIDKPRYSITISKSPSDVAEGVSYLSSSIQSNKPDKSYPSLRSHPPTFEMGKELDIPNDVKDLVEFTGINFKVPNNLRSIFISAPLIYYLQASVDVEDRDDILIQAGEFNIEIPFNKDVQSNISKLLRKIFWLDCLVRNAGPFEINMDERKLLDEIDFDENEIYSLTPKERFMEYCNVDFENISSKMPEWHFATYVNPVLENVSTIPHLLNRLSLIYFPSSQKINRRKLLEESLDELYRSTDDIEISDSVLKIDPKLPNLKHGRFHGWIADEFPVGVFKITPKAFQNRLNAIESTDSVKRITVVLNDSKMAEERSTVSKIYRDRSEELSIELSILENISSGEMENILKNPIDFLHFIGHCNKNGLECTNGMLSVESLDYCNLKTFFLNACGSHEQGLQLVDKGAIGGVVTRNKILDRDATRIGTEFARLAMHNFNLEYALQIAKKKSFTSYEYSVVGDGGYRLSQSLDLDPVITHIDQLSADQFSITTLVTSIRDIGRCYRSHLANDDIMKLCGNSDHFTRSRSELVDYLSRASHPTIYNGTYYWSDDLRIKLQN